MFHRFEHETEFYPTLSRLPLYVRMKLDITGVKVSLKDWLAFSMEERQVLCHFSLETEEEKQIFSSYLNFLCRKYRGKSVEMVAPMNESLWNTVDQIPQNVLERSQAEAQVVNRQEWNGWKSHQRYAIYKTAISKTEPEQFFAVLKELRQR